MRLLSALFSLFIVVHHFRTASHLCLASRQVLTVAATSDFRWLVVPSDTNVSDVPSSTFAWEEMQHAVGTSSIGIDSNVAAFVSVGNTFDRRSDKTAALGVAHAMTKLHNNGTVKSFVLLPGPEDEATFGSRSDTFDALFPNVSDAEEGIKNNNQEEEDEQVVGKRRRSYYWSRTVENVTLIFLDSRELSTVARPSSSASDNVAASQLLLNETVRKMQEQHGELFDATAASTLERGGGVSVAQLRWFDLQLKRTKAHGGKAIVFSYLGVFPKMSKAKNPTPATFENIWNDYQITEVMKRHSGTVKVFISANRRMMAAHAGSLSALANQQRIRQSSACTVFVSLCSVHEQLQTKQLLLQDKDQEAPPSSTPPFLLVTLDLGMKRVVLKPSLGSCLASSSPLEFAFDECATKKKIELSDKKKKLHPNSSREDIHASEDAATTPLPLATISGQAPPTTVELKGDSEEKGPETGKKPSSDTTEEAVVSSTTGNGKGDMTTIAATETPTTTTADSATTTVAAALHDRKKAQRNKALLQMRFLCVEEEDFDDDIYGNDVAPGAGGPAWFCLTPTDASKPESTPTPSTNEDETSAPETTLKKEAVLVGEKERVTSVPSSSGEEELKPIPKNPISEEGPAEEEGQKKPSLSDKSPPAKEEGSATKKDSAPSQDEEEAGKRKSGEKRAKAPSVGTSQPHQNEVERSKNSEGGDDGSSLRPNEILQYFMYALYTSVVIAVIMALTKVFGLVGITQQTFLRPIEGSQSKGALCCRYGVVAFSWTFWLLNWIGVTMLAGCLWCIRRARGQNAADDHVGEINIVPTSNAKSTPQHTALNIADDAEGTNSASSTLSNISSAPVVVKKPSSSSVKLGLSGGSARRTTPTSPHVSTSATTASTAAIVGGNSATTTNVVVGAGFGRHDSASRRTPTPDRKVKSKKKGSDEDEWDDF